MYNILDEVSSECGASFFIPLWKEVMLMVTNELYNFIIYILLIEIIILIIVCIILTLIIYFSLKPENHTSDRI